MKTTQIAIDFDGTIADNLFPDIGKEVPFASFWIRRFKEAGATLILLTMRSDQYLENAINFCKNLDIEFDFVNENPQSWTTSNKVYANIYIDDHGIGCPLKENRRYNGKPYVDWEKIGPMVMQIIKERKNES